MNLINLTFGASGPSQVATISTGLIVALVGGIVLFLLNWARELLTAYFKKRSEAEVLAFSLATQIDKLIAGCAEVIDDPLYEDRETGIYESTVSSPTVAFDDSWNWAAFPTKLQYRIRSLPNKIYVANRSVSQLGEYGEGPPYYGDAFQEREIQFAWIGLEACIIAETLVREYKVPTLERGEWDPANSFKEKIKEVTRLRQEEEEWRRQQPSWLRTPDDELQARRIKLAEDLDQAQRRYSAA